ncbi:UDP-N-acetylglucosamine--N-acetylmuramyl-(pentapeptide) pyrophosphoryl-undecaprenol N-acetylglucosamine transferase [Patescibacteria group bacterium]|nr:UDP-N-acetylglucosamine--N-acetylmuramyl-(pentapeptide) pyrophosphoryl-undecaprenol N-acetylglucosamine transferase [Patescibacteria group bacterium]
MKKLHVVFTGGGTGGHIYPLIAVAQELKKKAGEDGVFLDMRYFGAAVAYAQDIVDNDMEFVPILSSKLRRYWSLLNVLDGIKFIMSIPQLLWKLFLFMPDVVLSKGGPGALPVVLVARWYRIPVIVHESDSVPGLTNVLSGRWAEKVFLAFPSAADYFRKTGVEVVGNPVRPSLLATRASLGEDPAQARQAARKGFGLNDGEPLIAVLGGSQGAEKLNDFVLENLEDLLDDFQIIHQTGSLKYDSYKSQFDFTTKEWGDMEKGRYVFRPFFGKELADVLTASDLVISRAGSGSLFELAAFGKPAVIVPFEHSARDHQRENAIAYEKAGACVIVTEENLLSGLMTDTLKRILGDQQRYATMSQAAQAFYRPDAAYAIAVSLSQYAR